MDIDLLKSVESEDQLELIMMMQMEKLSDFCGPYNDVVVDDQMQTMEFHGGSSSSGGGNVAQIIDNPHVASSSPAYMNLPSTISFGGGGGAGHETVAALPFLSGGRCRETSEFPGGAVFPFQSQKRNSMAAMREMIFRIAAMQPIHIDPESVKPPKRRNVKISKDPQSVAARHRRERISERIRILQRLVPGGTKMDTASMLDEAIHYVKFLKTQVQSLERAAANRPAGIGFPVAMSNGSYIPVSKANYQPAQINVQHYSDA